MHQAIVSASTTPCILSSCGAIHQAICFDLAKRLLEAIGFPTGLVSTHPSMGVCSSGRTLVDDVVGLQAHMSPHADAGHDFIVIGYFLRRIPGCRCRRRLEYN